MTKSASGKKQSRKQCTPEFRQETLNWLNVSAWPPLPVNLRGSMSAKVCCYDNACAESFFRSLKVECIHGEDFASWEIMRTAVFNYIECDYNRWRRHSACSGLSPEQFVNQNLT